MKHDPIMSGKRKAVNITLDTGVVAMARELKVNLSRVSEAAIRAAATELQEARWREEHRDWIAANNAWVEEHGLPLEKYRLF